MVFVPSFSQLADSKGSLRFVVLHLPPDGRPPAGLIVHAPAFADEMNKSRRMVALQARALSEAGMAVVVPDLYGCGDSPGRFVDASWAGWVGDIANSLRWLRRECARRWPLAKPPPAALWGLRSGGLLAVAAANELAEPCHIVVWQPVLQGRTALQQFLRVLSASQVVGAKYQGDAKAARAALKSGGSWEVAGYQLPAAVASGLEESALEPPALAGRLAAFELSTRDNPSLSPALDVVAARWAAAGWEIDARVIRGPSFWQTAEIEDAPLLIDSTTAHLCSALAAAGQAQTAEFAA